MTFAVTYVDLGERRISRLYAKIRGRTPTDTTFRVMWVF